ncbi:MAG: hypothetical protein IKM23_06860 [Bacteroidales bacterium]|nr:hypothetical protein [Bacteroidales bacterium]
MRRWIKYIVALLIGASLLSCRNSNGENDSEGGSVYSGQAHTIVFSMSLDDKGTRGDGDTWDNDYTEDIGNSFENKILPESLRVAIYTADNIRLGEVRDIYYWPSNQQMTEYKFMGSMPAAFTYHLAENDGEPIYKIMVMANCPQGIEENLTYNYRCLDTDDGAIPMWGIKKVDLSRLVDEQSVDIGTIQLLRAAAKLEVNLSNALIENGTVINNVYINYYNQTGYCLPTDWDNVDRTEDLNRTDCFRLYRHTAINHVFMPKDNEKNAYYVYVPEYDNTNVIYEEEKAKITVDLTHNGQQRLFENAISFCTYEDGTPVDGTDYNIIRNHIYRYNIAKITGESISLEYSVADWELEDWNNDDDEHPGYEEHDITYPTYHNPVVPYSFLIFVPTIETPHYIITETPEMYYNSSDPKDGAFECYFQITAPEGVQWKPNFMNSTEDYAINVYDYNGVLVFDTDNDILKEDLHQCTSSQWYKILIYPKNNDGLGDAIDFGIVYRQAWSSSYINLYINGEYDNIKWPESGNNPKLISIKHINQPLTKDLK